MFISNLHDIRKALDICILKRVESSFWVPFFHPQSCIVRMGYFNEKAQAVIAVFFYHFFDEFGV